METVLCLAHSLLPANRAWPKRAAADATGVWTGLQQREELCLRRRAAVESVARNVDPRNLQVGP